MKIPGHCFNVGQISTGIDLYLNTNAGFRGTATCFKIFEQYANIKSVSYSCVRQWVLRLGFGLLNQPIEKRTDWIYIIDFSIQLGQERCFLILGTTREELQKNGFALQHSQVQVLDIYVKKKFDGQLVSQRLSLTSEKTGEPVQIVSDNGNDVRKGIEIFCSTNQQTMFTYDISHKIGVLLKKYMGHDERWQSLQADLAILTQQVKQSDVSFLRPIALSKKARWLNIDRIIQWLGSIYNYIEKADFSLIEQGYKIKDTEAVFNSLQAKSNNKYEGKRLIKELEQTIFNNQEQVQIWIQDKGSSTDQTVELIDAGQARFEDKFSVLQSYSEYFKELEQLNNMLINIKSIIKTKGLCLDTLQKIEIEFDKLSYSWVKKIYYDLFNYLQYEHSKSGIDSFPLLCCSDIIESVFGKFKVKVKQSVGGIYESVLLIVLTCSNITYSKIKEILSQTNMHQVKQWFDSMAGISNLAKRKIAFNST